MKLLEFHAFHGNGAVLCTIAVKCMKLVFHGRAAIVLVHNPQLQPH